VDGAVLGSPVVGSNATLYVGSYAGMIYAMDTANGTTRWTTTADSWIWSGPVIDEANIYYGDGNGDLYGYPLSGTSQPWKQALNGAIIGSPLVTGDTLVVATEGGNVYFADKTGLKVQPISIAGKIYSTPIAAGDLTLVAPLGGNATVVALDSSGAIKWSFTPPK
jgi:outer membrane protein assembly factor BamB